MAVDQQDDRSTQTSRRVHPFWDFWGPILFTFALYLGIRHYIVEARYIPSGSMLPGLQIQDRLLVEKLTYRFRRPERGEIVVFHSPYALIQPCVAPIVHRGCAVRWSIFLCLAWFPDRYAGCDAYIKRVIATAGDQVSVNPRGEITLNGKALDEPYVESFCRVNSQGMSPCRTLDTTVPEGSVLVLGDNRRNSWDGRFWPGGAFLPEQEIIGRAVWRFWPLNRLGSLSD